MEEIKLTIHPFEMDTLKEAAKKVHEEAGEAFAEYVILQEQQDRSTASLADEIADTIQAACNLAARYNIDLQGAMVRCEQRNRERGRYEDEDARPCGVRDNHDCDCGGDCGAVSAGTGVLREKSPEEMSVEELIEALSFAIDNRVAGCGEGICEEWCDRYPTCADCRQKLLDLLKEAYEQEVVSLEYGKFYYKEKLEAYDDDVRRRIADLTHERDWLRNRLAELNEAGITRLHKLLRETLGEAKNVTGNARVYIEKQQRSKDEHCGSRGSIGRDNGGDCGAECVGEHILSAEPPAQEMSEREAVIERLRGYAVYMAEPPSENANRLLACITGKKDARIACVNDVVSTRDKLIELIGGVNDAG